MIFKKIGMFVLVAAVLTLSGCSALHTAIKHRNLEVKTQMSASIFLPPSNQKTIYIQVKNTSNKDMNEVAQLIAHNLEEKGYSIVTDPNQAYYWIQANILKADKMKPDEANNLLASGYGSAFSGAITGATAAVATGHYTKGAAAAGLLGGAAGFIADALVENINYSVVTDVQISLQSDNKITSKTESSLAQGTDSIEQQNIVSEGNRVYYRTRVVSSAEKVNLDFKEAKPALETQLASSIANII